MMRKKTGVELMAEPRVRALLVYTDGGAEQEVAIERLPFTIGRLPDRDVVLTAPFVSRQHAEIVEEGERFVLCDLGSKGGCFVNGGRVQRHVLSSGDVIHIGSLDGPPIQFKQSDDDDDTTSMALSSLLGQIQEGGQKESGLGRLGWFLEAARRLNDLGAVHEIVGALIESTLQLTRAERGYVFLADASGALAFSAGRDLHGKKLTGDATISRSAIQQAVASRSAFIVTDTLSAEGFEPSQSVLAHSLRVVICIPLRKRGEDADAQRNGLLGVLYLDSTQQRTRLTSVDSNLLNVIAAEAAALVQNAVLAEAEKAARQARAELQIAAQIQRALMAVRLPQLPYAAVSAESMPCKEIGGDFFDVLVIEGVLHVVVADVSGKGVSAALLGAMLQGLVHAKLLAGESLERIAASANDFLCSRELGKYATMVLLRLRPDGMAEYINCGHVRPLRVWGPRVETLLNGNVPVGLLQGSQGAAFACEALQMKRDERIVIVTDGLTEAEDEAGQCFGDACLNASLRKGIALTELLEELRGFTCGHPLEDDCTVLEVRFLG